MKRPILLTVALLWTLIVGAAFSAEEKNPKVEAQMKTAQENWALIDFGDPVVHETTHLLIFATKSQEARLKEIGELLEKHYTTAEKVLQLDPKKELWPGKLTVYLFAERAEFTAFIRRVEKRKLEGEETSAHMVKGDFPRVITGPPRGKPAVNLELHCAEEVACALLQRKAGANTPLPDWLVQGFGRATTWRIAPRDKTTTDARREAIELVVKKGRTAQQVWSGGVVAEEAVVLRPTLADLLAYGPGSSRFAGFLAGFRPEEGQERKSVEQAMQAAGIKVENLAKVWPDFVRNLR